MIKMVRLLVRKDGLSHEEFVEYWHDEHAPLVDDLPGVLKYATSVPKDPERADYDGVLELYFEDTAALGAAFESEAGERVQADAGNFIEPDEGPTLIVEETVHVDELDG